MDVVTQILAGVTATVLGTVLTAVILHRLRLNKDGTPYSPATSPNHAPPKPDLPVTPGDQAEPEHQPATRGRRELTMKVLLRHGLISPGTEIEPMPEALPPDAQSRDPNLFKVRIGNPPGRDVVWVFDNNTYSLTNLSVKLWQEHGLQWFKSKTFEIWRIVGQKESMWDVADNLLSEEARTA